MSQAGLWSRSRSILIASMLPVAVILGTGVVSASPGEAAPVFAGSPTTADWLSLSQHEQGSGPFAVPTDLALLDQSPVGIAPPVDTRRDDRAVGPANPLAADSWTGVEKADAPDLLPPTVDQQPIQDFCASIPGDPRRCTVTVTDTGVGAAIGAGIAVAAVSPAVIASGIVGAVAGFVSGIPFLPAGLVVLPVVGAAIGVGFVAGPAALVGGAVGALVGAIVGLATPLPDGQTVPQTDNQTDGSHAPVTSP
ncbi:hypothetical protein [Nocardia sp. NPDC046763]|uniref:hypothetical protein n=1 Tax=Nocardia sp. NPDC046763 TaxID=3155256 RepID=UPI0033D7261B